MAFRRDRRTTIQDPPKTGSLDRNTLESRMCKSGVAGVLIFPKGLNADKKASTLG